VVESLAATIVGTVRAVCPTCHGGSSGEETFLVTRHPSGEVSGKCFRASCDFYVGPKNAAPVVRIKEPRLYTRPTQTITPEQDLLIEDRFGLAPFTVSQYSAIDDRFILPVQGPSYQRRGVVAYSLSGGTPKSLTYNECPEEPFIHWARGAHDVVVVVEDWFSAEKVAEAGGYGVAIMGTNLTRDMVAEIAAAKAPTVIALDQDAYGKAIKYREQYAEQFPKGLKVWRLARDLKYEPIERIQRAFNGEQDFHDEGTTNRSSNAQGPKSI
jgi:hypothetical protein